MLGTTSALLKFLLGDSWSAAITFGVYASPLLCRALDRISAVVTVAQPGPTQLTVVHVGFWPSHRVCEVRLRMLACKQRAKSNVNYQARQPCFVGGRLVSAEAILNAKAEYAIKM